MFIRKARIDHEAFALIRRAAQIRATAKRIRRGGSRSAIRIPEIIGLKLTNRCNLRCLHCYQWNKNGSHRSLGELAMKAELNFEIVEKVFHETCTVRSSVYLWGGEPLTYAYFSDLMRLLERDPRIVAICTNGTFLTSHMDDILRVKNIELLIALDGFEEENDAIRGKGNFNVVLSAIEQLKDMEKSRIFTGKISIHCVIHDRMVGKLFKFARFLECRDIHSLILCFPWYLSYETSEKMNRYFLDHLSWLGSLSELDYASWRAFKYRLMPELLPLVKEEIKRIKKSDWGIRLRFQPDVSMEEIDGFILGNDIPASRKNKCFSIYTRMDVLPDGRVTPCKHFPELAVGNLEKLSVETIWNSEVLHSVQEIVNRRLMPVCSKCNNLYLHG